MKNILTYANSAVLVVLVVGLAWGVMEFYDYKEEIDALKQSLNKAAPVVPGGSEGAASELEARLSLLEDFVDRLTEQSVRDNTDDKEKIQALQNQMADDLFGTIGNNFNREDGSAPATIDDVKKIVQEELQKSRSQRNNFRPPERKTVTIDELAEELKLTYDQKIKLQQVLFAQEQKLVEAAFGIKDQVQMQAFKTKLILSANDENIKKELTQQVRDNRRSIFPVFGGTITQIREVVGNEKLPEYFNYEVDTKSEFAPALKIIQDSFGSNFGPQRNRGGQSQPNPQR
ncbi:MAG: hypothetical protein HY811_10305 [Planctomycetes bacterium]|nr:hypothetical protein [Planctomycetota bacterium]